MYRVRRGCPCAGSLTVRHQPGKQCHGRAAATQVAPRGLNWSAPLRIFQRWRPRTWAKRTGSCAGRSRLVRLLPVSCQSCDMTPELAGGAESHTCHFWFGGVLVGRCVGVCQAQTGNAACGPVTCLILGLVGLAGGWRLAARSSMRACMRCSGAPKTAAADRRLASGSRKQHFGTMHLQAVL